MNPYRLNRDEEELYNVVCDFAKNELATLCKKARVEETLFPSLIFKSLAELGLTGLSISPEYGGLAGSPLLQAAVYDELASVDLGPATFSSVHGMVSSLIQRFGSDTQKTHWLPPLAKGEKLCAFALSEPQAGSDASNLSSSLTEEEDGTFRLSGEKCWITSAGAADLYIVFARLKGTRGKEGVTALLVEKDLEGLSISPPEEKMGCELSPIGSLSFSDCPISSEHIVGEVGQGMRIAFGGLTGGRINIAAAANGLARTALRRTIEHVTQRKQFGQTLGSFQGVQFTIAEMKINLDAAILLVREAAEVFGADPKNPDARLIAGEAKYFATETAMQTTTDTVQLHGAMGYMKETGVEQLMRDAKMLQIVEGANEIQKSIIARTLLNN